MTRLRDNKRRARRDLHREMCIPAIYIVAGQLPVQLSVRLHTSEVADGGNTDDRYGEAVRRDIAPRVIFNSIEVAEVLNVDASAWLPARSAKLSVELGEAYLVGEARPRDDEFVTAAITRLPAVQTAGLPVP